MSTELQAASEEPRGGLTVFPAERFAALVPGSEQRESVDAIVACGETFDLSSLKKVKTPSGGSTTWMIPGARGETPTQAIEGILVGYFTRGVLWPSDDPRPGTQPVLVTNDMVHARIIGEVPPSMVDEIERCKLADGTVDWNKLAYTQFGSGKNGHGKRAKEQRLLFILRAGDALPLQIIAQPGSLKKMKQFIVGLPDEGLVPWRAVVRLTLMKDTSGAGIDYSQIQPTLIGKIDAEAGRAVKATYYDNLAKVCRDQVDVE